MCTSQDNPALDPLIYDDDTEYYSEDSIHPAISDNEIDNTGLVRVLIFVF